MKRWQAIFLTLILIPLGAPYSPALSQTLRMGLLSSTSDAGIFIAQERGYFQEQRLEVKLQPFRSAADMMVPISRGDLEVASGAVTAGLFNAVGREWRVVMVADKGSLLPGRGYQSLIVRKDLWESGQVRTVKDLKGRVVAPYNAPGASGMYMWAKALEAVGLRSSDVTEKILSFPAMMTAMETKAIDAANSIEPTTSAIEAKGVGVRLITMDKVVPNMQVAGLFYSEQLVTKNPELGRRFMVAYVKGVRDYNDALKSGGQKLEEIIQILIKHTPIKERKVYDQMVWPGLNPNGFANKESISDQQRFFHEAGLVKEMVPIEKVVNDAFVTHALQVLGRYEVK